MQIPEEALNREQFNKQAGEKFADLEIDAFKCPDCERVFIANCYQHVLFPDPLDLQTTRIHSTGQCEVCPQCKTLWYPQVQGSNRFPKITIFLLQHFPTFFNYLAVEEWRTEDASLDNIRNSEWRWLLKDQKS